MGYRIGDAVRMRPGADLEEMLGEAADLTGRIGDVWTDARGERISVMYETVQILAYGLPAADFVPDRALAEAPF